MAILSDLSGAQRVQRVASGSIRFLDYHDRQRSERSNRNGPVTELTLASLNDTDRYLDSYKKAKNDMGLGAGTDGVRGDECTISEMAGMLRELQKRIADGSFVPQDHRQVETPKGNGKFRKLSIPVVAERVIARTFNNALLDVLDAAGSSVFPEGFHAYRRNRNITTLFAQIAASYARNGALFIGTADIENAFPSTKKDDVAGALERYVPDSDFRNALLRLSYVGNSQIGLPQGLATSTTLFMMVLSHRLTWSIPGYGDDKLELLAYSDNLIYAGSPQESIETAHGQHKLELEAIGMLPKASEPLRPVNVAHGQISLLGTTAFPRYGVIAFRPTEGGWDELAARIRKSYAKPLPSVEAHSVITNWISQNQHIVDSYGAEWIIQRLKGFCEAAHIDEVDWTSIETTVETKSQEWRTMVAGATPHTPSPRACKKVCVRLA